MASSAAHYFKVHLEGRLEYRGIRLSENGDESDLNFEVEYIFFTGALETQTVPRTSDDPPLQLY